jgi:[acyl-carrier-protein] S-malonyltransferase
MGYHLYHSSTQAKAIFDRADEVLQLPLSRLCFQGPEEELQQTINSQPAILTTSLAYLRAQDGLPQASFVAGHSLGEYTALAAAEVVDFDQLLRLVRERGRLMQEVGQKTGGGMVAIIGLDEPILEKICLESGARSANFNCPGQIVISGSKEAIARAMRLAKESGARRTIPLKVSGAFHTLMMRPAAEGIASFIPGLDFHDPTIPVIANTTAQPLTSAEDIKAELVRQLSSCIQWQRSVEYMIGVGVNTFIEIGPGKVLTGLVRRISDKVQVINIGCWK